MRNVLNILFQPRYCNSKKKLIFGKTLISALTAVSENITLQIFGLKYVDVPEERNVKEMLEKFMFQLNQKLEDEKVGATGSKALLGEVADNANFELLKKEYRIHDMKLFIYCRYCSLLV